MTNQTENQATTDTLAVAVITTDGDLTSTTVPTASTLTGLCALIDCRYVDVVHLADGLDMWLDDEGLINNSPMINVAATLLARVHGFTRQPYAGNVVLTGGADKEGKTLPLDPGMLARIRFILDL